MKSEKGFVISSKKKATFQSKRALITNVQIIIIKICQENCIRDM